MRANFTATAILAQRSFAFVVAKIQVVEVVRASVGAIQRKPGTFFTQRPPAGLMAMLRNQGVNSSFFGVLPKPTGAETFHTIGTFQLDNLVRGLKNYWQTPDTFIGAIQAVNDR